MNKVASDDGILHRRRRLSPRLHSDAQLVNPAVSVAYFESFAETSMLLEEQNSTSTLRRDHHHPCPQAPGANYSHFRPLLHKNDRRSAFALTHSLTHPPTHTFRPNNPTHLGGSLPTANSHKQATPWLAGIPLWPGGTYDGRTRRSRL